MAKTNPAIRADTTKIVWNTDSLFIKNEIERFMK